MEAYEHLEHGVFNYSDSFDIKTEQGLLNYNNSSNTFQNTTSGMFIPLYIYMTVSIVNAIIFIVGTFGNILVIIVVIKVRNMRTPTNVFLLNLSVADILVLLVCQPAGLLEFFGKDRWFLGKAMCKLVPLMENGVLHVSILTIMAVTLERYKALCQPYKGRTSYTISSTVKTIIGIWILGSAFSFPFLVMTEHEEARFYDGSRIKVCRTKVDEPWRYFYTIMIVVVFLVLPLFVLVGIYWKIIKQLTSDKLKSLTRNDPSAAITLRSRKQVVKMLIIIVVLFFVSLCPIRAVTLWLVFTPSEDDVTKIGLEGFLNLIAWARILMYVNSAGNPIIYSLTSTKFKRAFKSVLRRYLHNSYPGTLSTRYNVHKNVPRPVVLYKCKGKEETESGNYRRKDNPCLVIHLILEPEWELRHNGNSETSTDNRQTPEQMMHAEDNKCRNNKDVLLN